MASVPPLFATLLLADARLPSGGHAQSAGVEPALLAGLDPAELPALLRARVRTTTLVEAGTAVVARAQHRVGTDLDTVERAWEARTPSAAQRDASRLLARGYLRVGTQLLPDDPALAAWRQRATPPPRPCVLGVVASGLGIGAGELARLVVYEDLQAATAAVLKLEPRDPLDLVSLVAALCAEMDARLDEVAVLTDPSDIPAASAPQSEAWAEAHARSRRRLFRA
ncbi:urease accessory protein UreF [Microbacterium proteolyticum]|uniref:urease accessory protein UreF n=1 Tax=Microbacterium proteolyticum TaxID=1572644 RepID=UPI001FABD2C4|nr:urease accessory UreF family protein [Microbacterium proteolyticum]MCI9859612.1 urease accessory protein [Microbacterium proteolyticum]